MSHSLNLTLRNSPKAEKRRTSGHSLDIYKERHRPAIRGAPVHYAGVNDVRRYCYRRDTVATNNGLLPLSNIPKYPSYSQLLWISTQWGINRLAPSKLQQRTGALLGGKIMERVWVLTLIPAVSQCRFRAFSH